MSEEIKKDEVTQEQTAPEFTPAQKILAACIEGDALAAKEVFESTIVNIIADKIEEMKPEIAASMFVPDPEEFEEEADDASEDAEELDEEAEDTDEDSDETEAE